MIGRRQRARDREQRFYVTGGHNSGHSVLG